MDQLFRDPMNVTEDLRPALEVVIARIEQEALRSGEPLNDEQRFLLNNLPTESALPAMDGTDPESPPLVSIPRDLAYECLIALAREARRNDRQANPASAVEWKLAYVVSKLNRHPMAWLLEWAGMKEPKPWWDRPVLVVSALLVTGTAVALLVSAEIAGRGPWLWIGVGIAPISMLGVLWLLSRRMQDRHLRGRVEGYRGEGNRGGR
jgi:hypothetical protein